MYKIKGKMIKHELLLNQAGMRSYLPETHWLTSPGAMRMLKSYSSIFIKPNRGSGGTGIINIRKVKNGYELLNGPIRKTMDEASIFAALQSYEKTNNMYIVQRGLELAQYNGSIFDVRMYLQKPQTHWIISGMVARVAARNQYVTNQHKGGHAEMLEKVLLSIFANNKTKVNECINVFKNIAMSAATTLDKRFADIRELGIDLAIEKNGRVWFIEANSRPLHQLFTQLPDKTMLYRIRRNKRLIQADRIGKRKAADP